MRRLSSSFPSREAIALLTMAPVLGGCSRAPLQDILGSFFPSWMLCAFIGTIAAALLRALLGAADIQQSVPLPMLTYIAFATGVTFIVWLFVFGH
ncbi:YtcA family lipoprotein [Swaminathania salitolerans]|uniref:YtcA family lipoprotein n=1 Tax=Swaminathania salitolerans TaxID=182838 RepID=UPI001649E1B9|nr:YtcA family lipoprotein [Swaminathania salitolerans]